MEPVWQTLKGGVRRGLAGALYLSKIHRLRHRGKVVILTYHRVLPGHELINRWVQPGMYVTTDVFEEQMSWLKDHFKVIPLPDLLGMWDRREWDNSARYCVITFDDGWLDNYLHAYPILKKLELPATIFLPTDFVGTDEWFWPEKIAYLMQGLWNTGLASAQGMRVLQAFLNLNAERSIGSIPEKAMKPSFIDEVIERCKSIEATKILELIDALSSLLETPIPRERMIVSWHEVTTMSCHQISFGSHSCSHRILTGLCADEIRNELENSQRVLKVKSGNYVPVFCYPNGNTSPQIQTLVKERGYRAAMGVRSGIEDRPPENIFDLRRISIHNDVTSTIPLYAMRLLALPAA